MKIAILGYSSQGVSAYEYWNTDENEVVVCDSREELVFPAGVKAVLGVSFLSNLQEYDLIVRGAPSIHPRDIAAANPDYPDILQKVTTVTNEFFKVCPSKNIIGVTGTKGKGTTSTLISEMLRAAGLRVHLGGNIGIPPLDLLKNDIKPEDWIVLELANFQLIDLRYSPVLAVCLMVVPEHMDWHKDMEEYVAAKQQMFKYQTIEDVAIYYAQNDYSKQIAGVSQGVKIPFMHAPGAQVLDDRIVIEGQIICETADIKLLGKHNWQNICAAVTAAWQIVEDTQAIQSVITTFNGLEHRLEFVEEIKGIKYYDDSFGTAPETAMVAIEAFKEPKVVILGGSSKEADFTELAKTVVANNVRAVIAIGDTGREITQALNAQGFNNVVPGGTIMDDIVGAATQNAQPGDVVLLSTACASFDMFANYKDRGEQFQRAVLNLQPDLVD